MTSGNIFFCFVLLITSIAPANQDRNTLSKLPWAKKEVKEAAGLFKGDYFNGASAAESRFKHTAGSYRIIHIAAHAVIDDSSFLSSRLNFRTGRNDNEDGYLYLYELYGMKLNAEMTVLSACNTGIGRMVSGEGMFSLARGFMYAGCPGILTTLWSIDDKSTSIIMNNFYRGIINGEEKDEALRNAKLDYINNSDAVTANPVYWGGIVSIGSQSPVIIAPDKNTNIFLYLTLISAVLIFAFFGRKKIAAIQEQIQ
jgi:CHAT domain-containing protein